MIAQIEQSMMTVIAIALVWNLILDWTISAGWRLQRSSAMGVIHIWIAGNEPFPDR